MTSMEKSLKNQYLDASNINARIHLHELYSTNKKGWFPWIFEQCPFKKDMSILENKLIDTLTDIAIQKFTSEEIDLIVDYLEENDCKYFD